MPIWTEGEIDKLWKESYSCKSEEDVRFLYTCWGGVVRWVLEQSNDTGNLAKLDMAVRAMDREGLRKACTGQSDDKVWMPPHHLPHIHDLEGVWYLFAPRLLRKKH